MKHYDRMAIINSPDFDAFYKNIKKADFRSITGKKLIELKAVSKQLKEEFKRIDDLKCNKYIKLMNRIRTNKKGYNITNDAEMYILFMFTIDPNFEMAITFCSQNRIEEIKKDSENKFGLYDPFLIQIEKFYIKNFLSKEKRNEVEEKIIKRIF